MSAIIVVSQLARLSELLITFGLTLENIFLPFLYLMVPFISQTIPIAFLFAVFLTFGRLSADGEYPALLASGFSLRRAAAPVMLVAGILYVASSLSALNLEAFGRREFVQFLYRKTQTELDNLIRNKLQSGVFLDNFLGYVLYAEKVSEDRSHLDNVLLAPSSRKNDNFTMVAPSGQIQGSVEQGNLLLTLDYGIAVSSKAETTRSSVLKFKRAEIDLLRIFREQILDDEGADDDFRSYGPVALWNYVGKLKANPDRNESVYKRARYLLHQRIGMSFIVISFALYGMVLGVSDPRRGKGMAYIGAILVIIGSFMVVTGMQKVAEQGILTAPWAVWTGNLLIFAFGLFLVYQKNRLPPSEGTLDFANLPLVGRKNLSR